jgi:hypothetical protein
MKLTRKQFDEKYNYRMNEFCASCKYLDNTTLLNYGFCKHPEIKTKKAIHAIWIHVCDAYRHFTEE